MANFWSKLNKPIFVLAPMADVTDAAFRYIIAKYSKYDGKDIGPYGKFTPHLRASGGPDAMWTEFVSADGLALAPEEGRRKLLLDLKYTEEERPIVAQFFTSKPEHMGSAVRLAVELGFDGVDINMGCPDRSVEKQGSGSALIKTPELAQELVRAAKRGIESAGGKIPVSVKTRLGYNKDELETWLPALLEVEPALVTMHARTRKEMSKVPARWERIKRAVEIRDELGAETLIFGNGDLEDIEDAGVRVAETGADGAMLGKAIFGNPWLFAEYEPTLPEKLEVLVEHTNLFEELLGEQKNFYIMKKHFKAYVSGFSGAGELRTTLMEKDSAREVEDEIRKFLKTVD